MVTNAQARVRNLALARGCEVILPELGKGDQNYVIIFSKAWGCTWVDVRSDGWRTLREKVDEALEDISYGRVADKHRVTRG